MLKDSKVELELLNSNLNCHIWICQMAKLRIRLKESL